MTRSIENFREDHPADTKVLSDISTHGWHVTGVFAEAEERGPEWAFSIGLFHSFGHPEIIVFGLKFDDCVSVINEIGQQVKAGKRYEVGHEYPEILTEPYKCAFRSVERKHYKQHVGYALWFYEDDPFPVQQCFWPDKAGKFPWDAACHRYVKEVQPLLFLA